MLFLNLKKVEWSKSLPLRVPPPDNKIPLVKFSFSPQLGGFPPHLPIPPLNPIWKNMILCVKRLSSPEFCC